MKRQFASRVSLWVLVVLALWPAAAAAQAQIPPGNSGLYRFNGSDWTKVDGHGTRVAVAPNGEPWVVNAAGEIYRRVREEFRRIPGYATDIAVGGDGTAWVIGEDNGIFKWNGQGWDRVEGNGIAIAADRRGNPWVVNQKGEIFEHRNGKFERVFGTAYDIAAGTGVWVIGEGNGVYELQNTGQFSGRKGTGVRVAVGARGQAWVVNPEGQIFRWNGSAFEQVAGEGSDIGANARGDVWVIGRLDQGRPANNNNNNRRQGRPRR